MVKPEDYRRAAEILAVQAEIEEAKMEKKPHVEYGILSKLLEMASDEFSNHGCNDFELENTQANRDLMQLAHEWNAQGGELEELQISADGTKIYTRDYFLMDYFSHIFKETQDARSSEA